MKLKIMAVLIAVICIAGLGCRRESRVESRVESGQRVYEACSNTAAAYFRAGVASAINAHFVWAKSQLENGVVPSFASMTPDNWKIAAQTNWVKFSPNDPYIKAP